MYKVEGIEDVNYVSRKTGKNVTGKILYLSQVIKEGKGFGIKVTSEYCKENLADDICIGDNVDFYYDKYSHVSNVIICN